ncbi:RhuM family protein [Flavobacterium chungnamense]|uniref:Virulence RhuM family protein n=1 Tax=Flavobacterium chungnamense TaxID=706182 RepID=A0ABP7UX35_9FLAO
MSDILPSNNNSISYFAPSGYEKIEAYIQDETIWLTQLRMVDFFGVGKSTISEHLATIYGSGELEKVATVRKLRTIQIESEREVTRYLEYCNLDAIISVGYLVNSTKATQFRIWATNVLKEFIVKFICFGSLNKFTKHFFLYNMTTSI